jgi:hypothetical protein
MGLVVADRAPPRPREGLSHQLCEADQVGENHVQFDLWPTDEQPDRSDVFRKESKNKPKPNFILNFRPMRTYFQEEAAIFTTNVIHQWKAPVKPGFWRLFLRTTHEYLNLDSRSIEIWYQKSGTSK